MQVTNQEYSHSFSSPAARIDEAERMFQDLADNEGFIKNSTS